MNIKISKKGLLKLFGSIIILIAFVVAANVYGNYIENKSEERIKLVTNENDNLNDKVVRLEEQLKQEQTDKAKISAQLRAAEEDLSDYGGSLKDERDNVFIEAYELKKQGKNEDAKAKIQDIDTTYLTDLQLYIYQEIIK